MSDFSLRVIADDLGKKLDSLSPAIENQINMAVGQLAQATYANIAAQVQALSRNPKNRQDYLRGLDLVKIANNSWLISLEGDWANKLESGFAAYDLKEVLLRSQKKVSVGSRAGQPWVRTAKSDGHKWAVVPFEHKPYSAEGKTGDLAADLKKLKVLNRQGKMQPFTQIFKDNSGNPIQGKVAVVDVPNNKNLAGLTKYQHVYPSGRATSVYLTYRIISQNSSGWQHPGFQGYQLFKQAEAMVERELKNIVETLL